DKAVFVQRNADRRKHKLRHVALCFVAKGPGQLIDAIGYARRVEHDAVGSGDAPTLSDDAVKQGVPFGGHLTFFRDLFNASHPGHSKRMQITGGRQPELGDVPKLVLGTRPRVTPDPWLLVIAAFQGPVRWKKFVRAELLVAL